jgi:hypothetical protein
LLLGDAMNVAAAQQDFAGRDHAYLVIRADSAQHPLRLFIMSRIQSRDNQSAITKIEVYIRGSQTKAGQARLGPVDNIHTL